MSCLQVVWVTGIIGLLMLPLGPFEHDLKNFFFEAVTLKF